MRFFTHSSAQTIPIVLCVDIAFYIIKCGFSYISFAIFLSLCLHLSMFRRRVKPSESERAGKEKKKKLFNISNKFIRFEIEKEKIVDWK